MSRTRSQPSARRQETSLKQAAARRQLSDTGKQTCAWRHHGHLTGSRSTTHKPPGQPSAQNQDSHASGHSRNTLHSAAHCSQIISIGMPLYPTFLYASGFQTLPKKKTSICLNNLLVLVESSSVRHEQANHSHGKTKQFLYSLPRCRVRGEGPEARGEGRVGWRGEAAASRGEQEGKDNGRRKEAGGEELWRRQGEGEDDSAVPRPPLINGGGEGGGGGSWLVAAQSRPPHSLAARGEARKWRRHGSSSACEVVEMCF